MGKSHKSCVEILQVLDITLTEQCLSQCRKAFTLQLIIFPISVSHLSSLPEIHPAWLKFWEKKVSYIACPSPQLKDWKTQVQVTFSKWMIEILFTFVSLKSYSPSSSHSICYYCDHGVLAPSNALPIFKHNSLGQKGESVDLLLPSTRQLSPGEWKVTMV